ncbi:glycoside/pentoside/hexuronide transporter [Histomonas meleagridis]|uniref:glycoside/pentoside/hexuronide transporter n=1 Tax=Histomonas meleagridis TaxID=135588 RepID=UPI00355A4F8E|nr:glycoside/pentoside/hexuronide transporter [Histomonas meleagridis]KAH0803792.1 glycoside/pentoside/hexuronide transporter [Histomonas meleagridis]
MSPCEALSYSICGFGQNLICQTVSSYLTYYMTDGLLIPSATVGYIMLGTRISDALNDPIMGTIVDHTHTKWGKSRPYLIISIIPIAILTILCFLPYQILGFPFGNAPENSYKIIVTTTVLYVLWSIAYTMVDVPYWGLATSMTSNTHQRGIILTSARLFCTAGAGLVSIIIPQLTNSWTKPYYDDQGTSLIEGFTREDVAQVLQNRFVWMVLIIVFVSIPMFYLGFRKSNERFYDPEQTLTFKENMRLLFQNKPLVLIVISGILGGGKIIYLYSTMYVSQYCFESLGGTKWATLFTLASVPGGLIASLLVPLMTKKYGKRNTMIISHIIGGVILIITYFICRYCKNGEIDNTVILSLYVIALVIAGVPQGFGNIITYAQIADCVEYMEWKTGKRGEGICFSMQTFINAIGIALGAAFSCFGLALAGIKDPTHWDMMEKSEKMKAQQFLVGTTLILPGACMIAAVLPYFFYDFNEEDQERVVREIEMRKKMNGNENSIEENLIKQEDEDMQ